MSRGLSRRRARDDDDPPTAARVVYVGEAPFSTDALDVITPKQLNALLDQGWSVQSEARRTVTGPDGRVSVDRVTLAQSRAVSRPRARESRDLYDPEDGGLSRALTPGGGMPARNSSYLGEGSDFANMGLNITTSKLAEGAFGLGVDAAKMGGSVQDCPFPPGSKPGEEWMRGFHKAGGVADQAADRATGDEAFALGQAKGRGPADVEVTCPYPEGSYLYGRWLEGFTSVGGTHIESDRDSGMV